MYVFPELDGERVKLLPLAIEHSITLYNCSRDPEVWTNLPVYVRTIEDMEHFVRKAIVHRDSQESFPYVVFDKETNEIVGTTRFLRISEENNNLNIGWTWYSKKVWRTRVNTETKYLLLKHAFENLLVNRIEIITTTQNIKSQKAIERLGAVREGVLRKKYNNSDYVFYSIIDMEWNEIKRRLEGFLNKT